MCAPAGAEGAAARGSLFEKSSAKTFLEGDSGTLRHFLRRSFGFSSSPREIRAKESKLSFARISFGPKDAFRKRKASFENDLDSARQRACGKVIENIFTNTAGTAAPLPTDVFIYIAKSAASMMAASFL